VEAIKVSLRFVLELWDASRTYLDGSDTCRFVAIEMSIARKEAGGEARVA
jgi:hypothetical protein